MDKAVAKVHFVFGRPGIESALSLSFFFSFFLSFFLSLQEMNEITAFKKNARLRSGVDFINGIAPYAQLLRSFL